MNQSLTSDLIDYFRDGPCGDCPKCFDCEPDYTNLCITYEAWEQARNSIRNIEKKIITLRKEDF